MELPHTQRYLLPLVLLAASAGCRPSLPAPNITTLESTPKISYQELCTLVHSKASFTVAGDTPMNGSIECTPQEASVVIFNRDGVQVRAIRLSESGVIVDEVSFISPDNTSTLELLEELRSALDTAHSSPLHGRVTLVNSLP